MLEQDHYTLPEQWPKKANSILAALRKRAENDPAVRMMYQAIGLSANITAQDDPELHVYQSKIIEEWSIG